MCVCVCVCVLGIKSLEAYTWAPKDVSPHNTWLLVVWVALATTSDGVPGPALANGARQCVGVCSGDIVLLQLRVSPLHGNPATFANTSAQCVVRGSCKGYRKRVRDRERTMATRTTTENKEKNKQTRKKGTKTTMTKRISNLATHINIIYQHQR